MIAATTDNATSLVQLNEQIARHKDFTALVSRMDYRDPAAAMAYERKLADALDEVAGEREADLFSTQNVMQLRPEHMPAMMQRQAT